MEILEAKAAVGKGWETLEKLPVCQLTTKVRSKKRVIWEAQQERKTIHFATLMDICHLKNSELEPQFQKYKGWVVLRGDTVKEGRRFAHGHIVEWCQEQGAAEMIVSNCLRVEPIV